MSRSHVIATSIFFSGNQLFPSDFWQQMSIGTMDSLTMDSLNDHLPCWVGHVLNNWHDHNSRLTYGGKSRTTYIPKWLSNGGGGVCVLDYCRKQCSSTHPAPLPKLRHLDCSLCFPQPCTTIELSSPKSCLSASASSDVFLCLSSPGRKGGKNGNKS